MFYLFIFRLIQNCKLLYIHLFITFTRTCFSFVRNGDKNFSKILAEHFVHYWVLVVRIPRVLFDPSGWMTHGTLPGFPRSIVALYHSYLGL